ncbi:MAG: hypothetical protein HY237_12875 [Acidobacteria bacterium]|nr:hypothetical protein [Acidobacteriota bacterium]
MATLGPLSRSLILAAALPALLLPAARVHDSLTELKSQFNRENEPARKAKALAKLGDAQFDLARRALDLSDFAQALQLLQDYRDAVHTAQTSFRAATSDPERRPGGFKQLQIHVRKSIRALDQIILSLPEDQRTPFDAVRKDLLSREKELIDLLFPRQPGKTPGPEKPKG